MTETALFDKVMQALLSGPAAAALLEGQRQKQLIRMRDLTAARRTASLRDSLFIDYQLFHIEADLRWIDYAIARLDVPATSTENTSTENTSTEIQL